CRRQLDSLRGMAYHHLLRRIRRAAGTKGLEGHSIVSLDPGDRVRVEDGSAGIAPERVVLEEKSAHQQVSVGRTTVVQRLKPPTFVNDPGPRIRCLVTEDLPVFLVAPPRTLRFAGWARELIDPGMNEFRL